MRNHLSNFQLGAEVSTPFDPLLNGGTRMKQFNRHFKVLGDLVNAQRRTSPCSPYHSGFYYFENFFPAIGENSISLAMGTSNTDAIGN